MSDMVLGSLRIESNLFLKTIHSFFNVSTSGQLSTVGETHAIAWMGFTTSMRSLPSFKPPTSAEHSIFL